jgi:hypothetical protein
MGFCGVLRRLKPSPKSSRPVNPRHSLTELVSLPQKLKLKAREQLHNDFTTTRLGRDRPLRPEAQP